MALNFNIAPFFDDFDPSDNYHRILFRPGYSVQARELTQSQTIIQNQITQFASSIYTQNTPISGGKVTTNLKCHYVKLNPTYATTTISISSLAGSLVTDEHGIIKATVLVAQQNPGNTGLFPTLILSYISGQHFTDSSLLWTNGAAIGTAIGIAGGNTSTGKSSVASISAGVFYVINGYSNIIKNSVQTSYNVGNFVNVQEQTTVLDAYDNTPSLRIGLNINENVVDSSSDPTLLDPAIGASNFQAPGASRYQITVALETRQTTAGDDSGFIELVRTANGIIVNQTDQTVYSTIDDYFAKRDFETNGDYIVEDFKLTTSPSINGTTNQYDLNIGKGVAYVRGYRIENQSNIILTSDRARERANVVSDTTYVTYGNYFVVDTTKGFFDFATIPSIDLHCVTAANIVSTNSTTYSSTLVGSALIRQLDYQYATNLALANTFVYNAHVSDINTYSLTGNSTSGSSTTSITFYDITGKFSNANNAYNGSTLTINSGTGASQVVVLSEYNGSTKTAKVTPTLFVAPDTTSTFTIAFNKTNTNSIVQANATYALTANANINVNGKQGYTTILQSAQKPELIAQLGMSYVGSATSSSYYTTQTFRGLGFDGSGNLTIKSNNSSLFIGSVNQSFYGEPFNQLFTVIDTTTGNTLPFNDSGNSAIVLSNTSIKFVAPAYAGKSSGIAVIASMFTPSADNTNIFKYKTIIKGNTTYSGTFTNPNSVANVQFTVAAGNPSGQVLILRAAVNTIKIPLYVADVKTVVKVYDMRTSGVTPTGLLSQYTDITTSFTFNDGQLDSQYQHSYIKLREGCTFPIGDIIVVFNYYLHSGGDGYFNINSYMNATPPETSIANIPVYVASNGITYNLGDCIDFRPSRKNMIANPGWEYTATTNIDGKDTHGVLLPKNESVHMCNYSYYLGRKDKLILSKDKVFSIIKGAPSLNPIFPTAPAGSLVLANIALDPYTSYVQGEGPSSLSGESALGVRIPTIPSNLSIDKIPHKRWAKSDITALQSQVNNLEYYTSLSLMEQHTNALQVPDSKGLNRFKNGILVDTFADFSAADTSNPDYSANINIRKGQLYPITEIDNYQLHHVDVLNSFSTHKGTDNYAVDSLGHGTTNIFTLPYSTNILINQPFATSVISANPFDVITSTGVMTINPPIDNWVNSIEPPSITISTPHLQMAQYPGAMNLTNAGDFASLVGTTTATNPSQGAVTQSYISQTVGLTTAEVSKAVSQGLVTNKGYVTNSAVAPFIRAQELIIRAKGLTHNSPVSCWFDGTNVDKWVTSPNVILLKDVTGTFYDDNIIGFYESNISTFFPIGRVVSTTVTSSNTVTLYVATTINPPPESTSTLLINAYFDSHGNFLPNGTTGSGNVVLPAGSGGGLHAIHHNGKVTHVGGGYTQVLNPLTAAATIYKSPLVPTGTRTANATTWGKYGFSDFLNQYGVWDAILPPNSNGGTFAASHKINITKAGSYLITADCYGSATIQVNGTTVLTLPMKYTGTVYTYAVTLAAGINTISWSAVNTQTLNYSTSSATRGYSSFALTLGPVTSQGADGDEFTDPNEASEGEVYLLFNTVTPPNLSYTPAAGTETAMIGGGSYYEKVTKLILDFDALTAANTIYVGSTITVKAFSITGYTYGAMYIPPLPKYAGDGDPVYSANYASDVKKWNAAYGVGTQPPKYITSTEWFPTLITGYDKATNTITVQTPVDISIGINTIFGGDITSTYTIDGVEFSTANAIAKGNAIPQKSTDDHGQFVGIFNVPGSNFYNGQRTFRLDNRTDPMSPDTATTYAEAIFTSGNISGVESLSASIDASAIPIIPVAQQSLSPTANPNVSTLDALAQSFIIDKNTYPNGVFVSSVDLFFQSKDKVADIKVSIVDTINGVPNGKSLHYSTTILKPSEVVTSNAPHYLSSTTATTFKFQAPVYIQPGILYAIMIQSSSKNYTLYFGEQNKTIDGLYKSTAPAQPGGVVTGVPKIGGAPYIGSLFESQNSITWTPDQTKDLMFTIKQCVFNTSITPSLDFVLPINLPKRKLGTSDVLYGINPNIVSNLYSKYTANTPVHALNFTTTEFTPTATKIDYQYSTTLTNTLQPTAFSSVSPGGFAAPTQDNLHLNDGLGERILLNTSNNSIQFLAKLTSNDKNVSPVLADDGITAYTVLYYINNMGMDTSKIQITNTGTGYNVATMNVTISAPDVGNNQAVVAYKTTSGNLTSVYVTNPGSGYLTTPTITINDPSTRSGNVNAVVTVYGETSAKGGNSYAKYITKPVTLTPDNESGDLRVYYTAYKPAGADIVIYYKILNSADSSKFTDQHWQIMTQISNRNVYSTDRSNLIEYQWAPGILNAANNNISYVSTNGQTYNKFVQFAIKAVMLTNDNTNVPFLSDIRALALPSGTYT